jgi:shikimate kinase
MKQNISLIGMPGAGKSTIGIILAKNLKFGFIDTDILIQINTQKTLQSILDNYGYMKLREIEEREMLKLNIESHVIATGGSAVYSDLAMVHLKRISRIIYLECSFEEIIIRINNFCDRGIAKRESQTFEDLFHERQKLYKKYADNSINCNHESPEELAGKIGEIFIK